MRSQLFVAALSAGLAAAIAIPQDIDFAAIDASPDPSVTGPPDTGLSQVPSFDPSVAAAFAAAQATSNPVVDKVEKRGVERRGTCSPQPNGSGPVSSPDTAESFLADPQYSAIANNAIIPDGYSLAFSALQGAISQSGYLGYYTLNSYDTVKCQQYCDQANGCSAFNVFVERDPTVDPGTNCANPPSTTVYKCSLWGLPVQTSTATNTGQWRADFHVVIAGSNGYNKIALPASQANFTGPTSCGGAIQAPLVNGKDTYIGMRLFNGVYDPAQCAAVCQATTQYDATHSEVQSNGTYKPCNFFNTYVVSKNGVPQGMYCAMYTKPWSKSYATNYGQYDGQGNYFSVSQSYGYALTVQDAGVVN